MHALLVQQSLLEALEGESKLDITMVEKEKIVLLEIDHRAIVLILVQKKLYTLRQCYDTKGYKRERLSGVGPTKLV